MEPKIILCPCCGHDKYRFLHRAEVNQCLKCRCEWDEKKRVYPLEAGKPAGA